MPQERHGGNAHASLAAGIPTRGPRDGSVLFRAELSYHLGRN